MRDQKSGAESLYTDEFYQGQVDESAASAAVVIPLLLELTPVRSVVDVGCGVGTWCEQFLACGVPEVLGIDGAHVNKNLVRLPAGCILTHDLIMPLQLERRFDLAICMEVAEHLPKERAASLVADLARLAPCVVFSAAVPGQGGTGHINEQYLSYWVALFAAHAYRAVDALRPLLLGNPAVKWWYQQNTVVFVSPAHPLLKRNLRAPADLVHPALYEPLRRANQEPRVGWLLRKLPGALARSRFNPLRWLN